MGLLCADKNPGDEVILVLSLLLPYVLERSLILHPALLWGVQEADFFCIAALQTAHSRFQTLQRVFAVLGDADKCAPCHPSLTPKEIAFVHTCISASLHHG